MQSENTVRNIFGWKHFAVYLSGSIDFDRSGGKTWRDEWTEKLIGIGIQPEQIFNPCKKPIDSSFFNLDNEAELMNKYRSRREWTELVDIMSQIVHVDLRLIDLSSLVIVNMQSVGGKTFDLILENFMMSYDQILSSKTLDSNGIQCLKSMHQSFMSVLKSASSSRIPTFGTLHEMVIAHQQHKPMFLVWEGGKETCSAWLMWMVGHNNVFATVDDLMTRLSNISRGRAACNVKDWLWLNDY